MSGRTRITPGVFVQLGRKCQDPVSVRCRTEGSWDRSLAAARQGEDSLAHLPVIQLLCLDFHAGIAAPWIAKWPVLYSASSYVITSLTLIQN